MTGTEPGSGSGRRDRTPPSVARCGSSVAPGLLGASKPRRVRRPLRLGRGPWPLCLTDAGFRVAASLPALPPGGLIPSTRKWPLRPCTGSGLRGPRSARLSYGASCGAAPTAPPALSREPHRQTREFCLPLASGHGRGAPRGSFCICSSEVREESPSAGSRRRRRSETLSRLLPSFYR